MYVVYIKYYILRNSNRRIEVLPQTIYNYILPYSHHDRDSRHLPPTRTPTPLNSVTQLFTQSLRPPLRVRYRENTYQYLITLSQRDHTYPILPVGKNL